MDYKQFDEFCLKNNIEFKIDEPMKLHTTFKIGGAADRFITVKADNLIKVISEIKRCEFPFFILGKGSNLLVSDKGIEGVVISVLQMNEISVEGEFITAGAGASLAAVCTTALENGLTGLEFAYGIPGSVGGALYMNAGAYGGEMSQVVFSAECLSENLETKRLSAEQMQLGYRTSVFKSNGDIITSITFKLEHGEKEKIRDAMEDYLSRRKSKQPLDFPSAGSTFKRPTGYFAGALIEQNNL